MDGVPSISWLAKYGFPEMRKYVGRRHELLENLGRKGLNVSTARDVHLGSAPLRYFVLHRRTEPPYSHRTTRTQH